MQCRSFLVQFGPHTLKFRSDVLKFRFHMIQFLVDFKQSQVLPFNSGTQFNSNFLQFRSDIISALLQPHSSLLEVLD